MAGRPFRIGFIAIVGAASALWRAQSVIVIVIIETVPEVFIVRFGASRAFIAARDGRLGLPDSLSAYRVPACPCLDTLAFLQAEPHHVAGTSHALRQVSNCPKVAAGLLVGVVPSRLPLAWNSRSPNCGFVVDNQSQDVPVVIAAPPPLRCRDLIEFSAYLGILNANLDVLDDHARRRDRDKVRHARAMLEPLGELRVAKIAFEPPLPDQLRGMTGHRRTSAAEGEHLRTERQPNKHVIAPILHPNLANLLKIHAGRSSPSSGRRRGGGWMFWRLFHSLG